MSAYRKRSSGPSAEPASEALPTGPFAGGVKAGREPVVGTVVLGVVPASADMGAGAGVGENVESLIKGQEGEGIAAVLQQF